MKALSFALAIAIIVTGGTIGFADDKVQRATTPPTVGSQRSTGGVKDMGRPLFPTAFQFSVPYSFTNVQKDTQYAVIRCAVVSDGTQLPSFGLGSLGGNIEGVPINSPQMGGGKLAAVLGQGETKIVLNGAAKSGKAIVAVTPAAGASFEGAKAYSCAIMLSDGKNVVAPKNQGASGGVPAWAEARPGSMLAVSGAIQ
jgi:hypothetical protein